jgi:hypothetical protein
MAFETLSHSPEFELPMNSPNYPQDLLSLIEECHEGLYRVVIHKFVRRGKYAQVATIQCQESASRKSRPTATPDDISEYCMLVMQYDIDKTDERGKYKVVLYGGMSKGRWERSKHVDLSDADGEAKTLHMMSEGDMLEQQQSYIGELHSQMIAMHETLQGMVKPILHENKEMMKIVTESQRRLGDVEAQRLKHDLELRMHNDDIKAQEAEEEHKMERWRELLGVVKETGAFEAIVKAVMTKVQQVKENKSEKREEKPRPTAASSSSSSSKNKKKSSASSKKQTVRDKSQEERSKSKTTTKKKTVSTDKAKKRKRGERDKQRAKAEGAVDEAVNEETEEVNMEELEAEFYKEAVEKLATSPLLMAAEALKMSIDEKKQWPMLRETLNEEQMDMFDEIFAAVEEDDIKRKLKGLYKMKGMKKLLALQDELDDVQSKFVEVLFEAATSSR